MSFVDDLWRAWFVGALLFCAAVPAAFGLWGRRARRVSAALDAGRAGGGGGADAGQT